MIHQRTRRLAAAASAMVAVLALSSCSSEGPAAVADDDEFSTCLDDADAPAPDLEGADATEQLAWWTEPGTLRCAVDTLDDADLATALAPAFANPEDADDFVATAQSQQAAVRRLALESASEGEAAAVDAVARVLQHRPDDAGPGGALLTVGALGAVQGADGSIPGYDDYLGRTDQDDTVDALTRYDDEVTAEGVEPLATRLRDLQDDIRRSADTAED